MFKVETIKTFAELDSEKELMEFKSNRVNELDSAVIEISSGKKFDASEIAQKRMSNAILALNVAGKTDADTLNWSLADTGSGVATEITFAELKEAFVLAVENMAAIWLR
mgnify:CR=1 FL=1